jgi:transcriptional regulator with XRE-family HTH domain
MNQIGMSLREARISRGYSQEEVADLAGLSQAAVSYIEAGKRGPGLGTLAIAEVLGVPLTAKDVMSK